MTSAMLDAENYLEKAFRFRDRQAGVSLVYDPDDDRFSYNSYCLEITLRKELFSCEYEYLEDALHVINQEFGSWELEALGTKAKSGCGSCVAKK